MFVGGGRRRFVSNVTALLAISQATAISVDTTKQNSRAGRFADRENYVKSLQSVYLMRHLHFSY